MGYLDAVTSRNFKTAADGRRLYFPWGAGGRGYVLASEQDYERLQLQTKIFLAVSLVLIIGTVVLQAWISLVAAVVLLMGFQWLWARSLAKRLQPSEERLSLQETWTTQARLFGPVGLWLLEVLSLVFVAGGIAILVFNPSDWLNGLFAAVFFGACAAVFARMLFLRRAQGS
jgi:hypothetical protein